MEQIEDRVRDFLEQNPDADLAQLQTAFGDPQIIAAAYVENTGTAEILRSLRIRRRIVTIVVAAVTAILLSWAVMVTWATISLSNSTNNPYIKMAIE